VWGARFLLVVIWLSVPLAALLMLRQDRQRYYTQSQLQRTDCLARTDLLRRYTFAMNDHAGTVESIVDPHTRTLWQRQWQDVLDAMQREQQKLRLAAPTHYPKTDAKLLELEHQLTQQQAAIEDAALKRDMYVKSGAGMLDLAQAIANARGIAEYYRRIGAQSIYLVIMDDLAVLEEEYQKREDEMNQRSADVHDAQIQAQLDHVQLVSQLDSLAKLMAEDESLTYEQQLARRLRNFNLREELRKLLTGPTPT
jgi:hypothetical protein